MTQISDWIRNAGHEQLLPMQEDFIRASETHPELVLYAHTGSGKTLAFLLAALNRVPEQTPFGIVLIAPTRELCLQIEQVFRSLRTGRKVLTCYGGHSMKNEINSLHENPEVIIATPGRLQDHILRERIPGNRCRVIIIDEFDKCLELGFSATMEPSLQHFSASPHKWLISATTLDEIPAYTGITTPCEVRSETSETAPDIKEWLVPCSASLKEELFSLLCQFGNQKSIVFCNYREVAEDLADSLGQNGLVAVCYHGGLEQEARERALIRFRNNSSDILVCTDLGARGLDIPEIMHVVHYQYPSSHEAFVHRQGRTARMGAGGNSYIFTGPETRLPEYLELPSTTHTPARVHHIPQPAMETLYFGAGKKEKLSKGDIVGFLTQQGELKGDEVGFISVLDHSAYVAIPRRKVHTLLKTIHGKKIKGKRIKIARSK